MSTCKANLKTWMLAVAAALAIILSSGLPADAASYEYKEYTVKKGDTLWSITKRELVDAYQWPLVW
ncbi:MAG: LysM peptidoglycan-binding domain-containing protein, partial [Thermodesulfovibrionales bacterium]|nr:LysM peptidoglycan-binding domain-containing protein [Thermodesulfovibrionales bacterium]